MKTLSFKLSLLFLILMGMFACKDSYVEKRTYTAYVPKYMSYDDMRSPVQVKSAQEVATPGKIYIKDQYLFVNERYEGIHVFDNTDPAAPVNLAFLDIPGNVDISVQGDYLYADSYVDLVVLDISDIHNPLEIARIKDIFPYTIPEIDFSYPISEIDQSKGVITGWEVRDVTVEENNEYRPYYYFDKSRNQFFGAETVTTGGGGGSVTNTSLVGIGGSLARFIIYESNLYSVNQTSLQVFNIYRPSAPVVGVKLETQRMVETVFIDDSHLFVGTQTGMLIYSVAIPSNPSFITQYDHFQSCDPVVVQDGLAYITMRAGNNCGNFQNQMDVVNLSTISSPQLLKSYPMTEPYGLGIDNKKLFVCDGAAGLKIYDATDPMQIDQHLLQTFTDINATDVIPLDGVLILMAADGIYQYDYTDLGNIHLLSKITIGG